MEQGIGQANRGFGVYVHIPYCVHKCSYCDFYSFTQYDLSDFETLLKALKKEIYSGRDWLRTREKAISPVTSIFFGGGTPSLLPGRHVRKILDWIEEAFSFSENIEITLEANPETVTASFCKELLLTKVNRISLGAQSFKPQHLNSLERLGKRESIHDAVQLLWEHGLRNLNLDFIFGIPGQTPKEFTEDLYEAASLPLNHLSAYQLSLKPAHKLFTQLPEEEVSLEFYEVLEKEIPKLGFRQYEISNYSKPGKECLHNLLYWNGGDYLGIGPSAASRFFGEGVFSHRKQLADVKGYLNKPEVLPEQFERTTHAQTVLEATFLEMRKNSGLDLTEFQYRYQYDLRSGREYSFLTKQGMIYEEKGSLFLSQKGRLLADTITSRLADV